MAFLRRLTGPKNPSGPTGQPKTDDVPNNRGPNPAPGRPGDETSSTGAAAAGSLPARKPKQKPPPAGDAKQPCRRAKPREKPVDAKMYGYSAFL